MKIETKFIMDVTQEGYKLLKHFSESQFLPDKYNKGKLNDLVIIGLVRCLNYQMGREYKLTLFGEQVLMTIEESIKESKQILDFFEGEHENN